MAAGAGGSSSWLAVLLSVLLVPGTVRHADCVGVYTEYEVVNDWGYGTSNGPCVWRNNYPVCRNRRQSPISLKRNCVSEVSGPTLSWCHYDSLPCSMSVSNNGRTVQLHLCAVAMLKGCWGCRSELPRVRMGDCSYVFENLHFHWGSGNETGSEHTINGVRYPLEMHVVHTKTANTDKRCACEKKKKKPKSKEVLEDHDVLVLVILFKVCDAEGEPFCLEPLWREFPKVKRAGSVVSIDTFPLSSLVPRFERDFFLYKGSLTTPPCTENVLYAVSSSPVSINEAQVEPFRRLLTPTGCYLQDNFRPLQRRNRRSVKFVSCTSEEPCG